MNPFLTDDARKGREDRPALKNDANAARVNEQNRALAIAGVAHDRLRLTAHYTT